MSACYSGKVNKQNKTVLWNIKSCAKSHWDPRVPQQLCRRIHRIILFLFSYPKDLCAKQYQHRQRHSSQLQTVTLEQRRTSLGKFPLFLLLWWSCNVSYKPDVENFASAILLFLFHLRFLLIAADAFVIAIVIVFAVECNWCCCYYYYDAAAAAAVAVVLNYNKRNSVLTRNC